MAAALPSLAVTRANAHEQQAGQEQSKPAATPAELVSGAYSAKAKALICGACAKKIKETAGAFPGVKNVSVDAKSSTLRFDVAPGQKVEVAKLQAALKAASDDMGMGADYSLSDIRKTGAAKKMQKATR
ncbi:MAG: cation transporter [Elusimicrobia bacterium]|nr:cation transporter [Elusimicrobiota bacterium]